MNSYYVLVFILEGIPSYIIFFMAVNQIYLDKSVFTYLHIGPIVFHALTAIALIGAYNIGCQRLKFLSSPTRQMYSAALVVTGIHFYDFFWGLARVRFPWGPLFGLIIAFLLLAFLEKQEIFFKVTTPTYLFCLIMVISFLGMIQTGFFDKMRLYDLGLGPDPNVGSYWWVLSKFSGLLIFPFSTMKGKEAEEIRMPFYDAI